MPAHKVLHIPHAQPVLQKQLSKEAGISPVLARLLINRGIKTAASVEEFLNPRLSDLNDPFIFADMAKAVSLLRQAGQEKKKVMVVSDYDVDGVTSLVLLKTAFARVGLDVRHYLPHRVKEGYGLNPNIVQEALKCKAGLLVTADCGSSDHAEIAALRGQGIEVIVTDHHEPPEGPVPAASAIINPKSKDTCYPFRELAGVGVAYKLCQALTGDSLFEDLDIVSLGTVADVVSLTGENRIMVKEGLKRISGTKKIGLQKLIEASGIKDKKITAHYIGFILGPRLNASGRMDSAEASLELLMSDNIASAEELAQTVNASNRKRQKVEGEILDEAGELIDLEVNLKEHKIIVLAKENWHPGVLGIVASKLVDRFSRPVIVISLMPGISKGSGRSVKDFHLFEALAECKDLLANFGGHSHAVGLNITGDNVAAFRTAINSFAREKLTLEQMLPRIEADMELSFAEINNALVEELERLEPFGAGNPEPMFYTRGLMLRGRAQSLGRNTLKFWVTDGEATFAAIGFGMAEQRDSLQAAEGLDLVYRLRRDSWQGVEGLILEIKEIFLK